MAMALGSSIVLSLVTLIPIMSALAAHFPRHFKAAQPQRRSQSRCP